ncbi:MAG: DNA polymerase Y family protein [Burkholderiales bacterium]|nr:DNA polymerase Y family protein [Burkholderiales bacterium]
MLWTCLHFPNLPLQVFCRASTTLSPLAVTSAAAQPSILACNRKAAAAGIMPGMRASAAQALCAALQLKARDEKAEAASLSSIAAWAGQFTPTISLGAQAVLLEIGGCFRLFGSLENLLKKICYGLTELGYEFVIASAATPRAASILARARTPLTVTEADALPTALSPLPLALLGYSPDAISDLAQAGIRSIGACLALPRDAVARRYGQGLLDEFDRALGLLPDPQPPFTAPSRFETELELPAPVEDAEVLLFALRRLVFELAGWLRARNAGVTRLRLALKHHDVPVTEVTLDLTIPSRDADHLLALWRERLARVSLPQRVEAIALAVEEIAELAPTNFSLFPETPDGAALLDRLRARLGDQALCRLRLHADHRPELAWRETDRENDSICPPANQRPLWLLDEPRRLGERPALDLVAGPERIEGGWWDGHDVARDYFVASDSHGSRFWIFMNRANGEWFLQGICG